jgi:hypothetical protein
VHVLGLRWHNGIQLSFVPEVVPLVLLRGGKDVVLLEDGWIVVLGLIRLPGGWLILMVLLTFSRLPWRRARELAGALLELLDEAALARGVGGLPAGGAVEPSRLVKLCIEGVFDPFTPLTAAGCPRASLVSNYSLRAGRALGERLLEVEP